MSDGIGCKCAARCEAECCCSDVSWEPKEIQTARFKIAELTLRVKELERTSEFWKAEHLAGNERIKDLDSLVSSQGIAAMDDADGLAQQAARIKELEAALELAEAELLYMKEKCLSEFGISLVNENILAAKDALFKQRRTRA